VRFSLGAQKYETRDGFIEPVARAFVIGEKQENVNYNFPPHVRARGSPPPLLRRRANFFTLARRFLMSLRPLPPSLLGWRSDDGETEDEKQEGFLSELESSASD